MLFKKKVVIIYHLPTARAELIRILSKIDVDLVDGGSDPVRFDLLEENGKTADLIIMDLTFKNDNGFDLIKKLRQKLKYKEIPIIVLTEHADIKNVLKAKQLGIADYLRKPISDDEILFRVMRSLDDNEALDLENI